MNMHRVYENDEITVFWNSDKCRHARRCVEGCPGVFDFARKPWIDLSKGTNPDIWQTISKCPSGALGIVYNHDISVVFEKDNSRSVALSDGKIIGECDYKATDEGWNIYHTEVLPEFGGKQIAKRLVYKVFEGAEREKKNIIPTCSYAAKILEE